jgi:type IV pilus assembly protein PilC
MPIYKYKARDRLGKQIKGKMEAPSKAVLAQKLKTMGFLVSGISQEGLAGSLPTFVGRLSKIKASAFMMFNVQLAALINAGVTLIRSLRVISHQIEDKNLQEVIGDLVREVEGGASLSQAMKKHPSVFSRLYVSMVASGELSGELPTILNRLAQYTEEQNNLRQKIKNALMYPVILTLLGLIIVLLVVTFVIPQFMRIFKDSGIEVPLPTLIVSQVGMGIKTHWPFIIIAVAGIYMLLRFYGRSERGRIFVDNLKLRLPVFGALIKKTAIARFSRTLGMLVSTGVPVIQALDISEAILGNIILSNAVKSVTESVTGGKGLAEPMRLSGQFPPLIIQMISTGEETGELDTLLDKTADYYETEVNHAVKRLTVLIEPFFLVLMGLIIGSIMASVMLPLFRMVNIMPMK